MKNLFIGVALIVTAYLNGQTNVGGVISGNVTWTSAGNPYVVTANTLVQFASTLTIMPGVQINVNQGMYLQVDGTIRVMGTAAQPVTFQPAVSGQSWGGIRFTDMAMNYDSTSDTGNRISHAFITGMDTWTPSISIDSSWVRVHKCEIAGGQYGVIAHNSTSFIDSNLIYGAYGGISCWDDATNVLARHNVIRGNTIHDCNFGMSAMRGIMEGNTIYYVQSGAGISNDWLFSYPPVFINNTIMYCAGTALGLSEMSEGGIFTGNIFRYNYCHLEIYCDPKCVVECNRFMECTGPYKVYAAPTTWSATCPAPGSGNYYPIDLDHNNWQSMTSASLDTMTHDFNDNFAVGLFMVYPPMLSDSDTCLSTIPFLPPPPNPSGLIQTTTSLQWNAYPNPATDQLMLDVNAYTGAAINIELLSIDGRVLYQYSAEAGSENFRHTIMLHGLSAGSYIVRVGVDSVYSTRRIVHTE